MATHETEKNDPTLEVHSNNSPASTSELKQTPPPHPGDASKEKHLLNLRTFQDLVGIRTPTHILSTGSFPSTQLLDLEKGQKNTLDGKVIADTHVISAGRPNVSVKDFFFKKTVTNDGIYGRAIGEALAASIYYNVSNWFINALYCVQIFVAASITGLASYHGHEIPLTVLGAVNAVLAGLMALLKGQGLPVRMRRSRDQFQNVMKTIENSERIFARFVVMNPNDQLLHDPFKEFEMCESLFNAAKRDQQANYPDLYTDNHERAAVQVIQDNNRTGGADVTAKMQQQIDELTAQIASMTKPTDGLSGVVKPSA
ncbi:hypothetical protein L207DRAFT_626977 [Hyaloscypha variabilis F]|uniref:SMODS and SLOG-associating 2TM effector domain-containing protein n=1 Tax=Hyaloscypha variabilis (strain UAMH 11265 / GT02V1 / F) TaxID=1149755 RepID=A0A2J6SBT5_HYAVF|nr:hypothetical protein L207DRAFT_626977 [Hyaloscypha variabilis F]